MHHCEQEWGATPGCALALLHLWGRLGGDTQLTAFPWASTSSCNLAFSSDAVVPSLLSPCMGLSILGDRTQLGKVSSVTPRDLKYPLDVLFLPRTWGQVVPFGGTCC